MSKKPGIRAEICDDCLNNQTQEPIDPNGERFYCGHNQVMAVVRPGEPGWLLFTHIDPDEYVLRVRVADKAAVALTERRKAAH